MESLEISPLQWSTAMPGSKMIVNFALHCHCQLYCAPNYPTVNAACGNPMSPTPEVHRLEPTSPVLDPVAQHPPVTGDGWWVGVA